MSPEGTDFLYPFIEADEHDVEALLSDLASSATGKAAESSFLRSSTLEALDGELDRAGDDTADRLLAGGRLYTFGNGGSSTDAASMAALFGQSPGGTALPARCLVGDQAVLTAIGNDVGYELTFSRQLIAFAAAGDIAVGYSTSGNSENVIRAFEEAKRRELLTIGFAGYEGGQMAACDALDHCFVVRSHSVHRIQETQAALSYALWGAVQRRLGPEWAGLTPHGIRLESEEAR
jgi:D-sedoheptulose 7-phosphate isomerase